MILPPPPDSTLQTMLRRIGALRPRLSCSDTDLLEAYWRLHPRFHFVKTVPADAALLDIGAGSGGLARWKRWLQPFRDDIVFYGVDRARGTDAHLYRRWECVNLDAALPDFPDVTFDAFMLSHVIEHLGDPARMITWIASRIRPGGRVYIEWPNENAARQPRREAFLRHDIDIMITNFFDDATHLRMIPPDEVLGPLTRSGFRIIGSGTVDLGLPGEEMLARGLANGDAFARLAGYWSMSGWSNWVVAAWPRDDDPSNGDAAAGDA
ncbi:class I SAM-dependent methyltransferase [Rhodopila sp.]|uniref:class I SAM-dependent methyltransferase n=1 Tax=Rhodopila sp. TaxID=2480087 RepID=UPI003D14ED35